MSRPYKPANIPGLIPYLTVNNAEESLDFYQKVFQFQVHDKPMEKDGKVLHAEMKLGEALIMFAPEGAFGSTRKTPKTQGTTSPMALFVYVENIDEFFKYAKEQGAEVIQEPQDMFWGDRTCVLKDIDGYDWTFGTNVKDFDASQHQL